MESSARKIVLEVDSDRAGLRIDQFIADETPEEITRSKVQRLIENGDVLVNGASITKSYKVNVRDKVEIEIPQQPQLDLVPEDIPIEIVYADEHLVVVNKPAGLVTHPGAGNFSGTLVNALLYHFKNLATAGDSERPGIVHRLDKDTTGLLLVARTDIVYLRLQAAIQAREVKRTYLALVWGHVKEEAAAIDLPIGRSRRDRKKMMVNGIEAREALTEYRLLTRFRTYDLLELTLQTGRTHQIRVHLAHLGHPVFGDPDYGGREKQLKGIFAPERLLAAKLLATMNRQALHAHRLEFDHPISGEAMSFEAELPEDFQSVLDILSVEGA